MADRTDVKLEELPMQLSLTRTQGKEVRYPLTLQLDTGSGYAAIDLTSVTYTLVVSSNRGGTAVLSKTVTTDWTTSGVKVIGASTGQITILIIAGDTTSLEGTYYYEVGLTFPSDHADLPSFSDVFVAGWLTFRDNATS